MRSMSRTQGMLVEATSRESIITPLDRMSVWPERPTVAYVPLWSVTLTMKIREAWLGRLLSWRKGAHLRFSSKAKGQRDQHTLFCGCKSCRQLDQQVVPNRHYHIHKLRTYLVVQQAARHHRDSNFWKQKIQAFWHKLRSFGIPVKGPADVFCDNKAVTKAMGLPQSTGMTWHKVREFIATNLIRGIAWEDTNTYLADLLTKSLTHAKWIQLIDAFLY
jgi:hypothetical protein